MERVPSFTELAGASTQNQWRTSSPAFESPRTSRASLPTVRQRVTPHLASPRTAATQICYVQSLYSPTGSPSHIARQPVLRSPRRRTSEAVRLSVSPRLTRTSATHPLPVDDPIAAKYFRSPGPKYDLGSSFSKTQGKRTSVVMPKSERFKSTASMSPGPGAYSVQPDLRTRGGTFRRGDYHAKRDVTPGPGQYDSRLHSKSKGVSIPRDDRFDQPRSGPGPAEYSPSRRFTDKRESRAVISRADRISHEWVFAPPPSL